MRKTRSVESDDDSMLSCLCLHPYFHFFTLVTAFKRDLSAQQNSNFSSSAGVFSVLTAQCTVHLHYRQGTDRCQCTLHTLHSAAHTLHTPLHTLHGRLQAVVGTHTLLHVSLSCQDHLQYLITTHSEDSAAQNHRGHQYIWPLQYSVNGVSVYSPML